MSDIEIIIKMPEEMYKWVNDANKIFNDYGTSDFINLVKSGTPLPKGHGRLKDEDEIVKAIEDRVEFLRKNDAVFMRLRKDIDILGCIPKIRCEVSTIIEADKESEEE